MAALCTTGQAITLPIAFVDGQGAPVTPVAVTAHVVDGFDQTVHTVTGLNAASTSVTIPGTANIIDPGLVQEFRELVTFYTVGLETFSQRVPYTIQAVQLLEVMVNSFQSFGAAEILAGQLVNAVGWLTADLNRRRIALAEAYERITRLNFQVDTIERLSPFDYDLTPDLTTVLTIDREQWLAMTSVQMAGLPARFRRQLCLAQVVEANELLQGDETLKRHRSGIKAEVIGESSTTFNTGFVDYGVSRPTLAVLTGYLHFNARIARA